ncbi:MFS transporter [Jatrophihabitans fulvus]
MASGRRWAILAAGTLAQAATCSFVYGMPMLVPALRGSGISLVGSGVLISAPIAGLLLTLILWGAAADRYGERVVIATGVGASAVLLALASVVGDRLGAVGGGLVLALAGAAGASVNAASGRMVMGWFPVTERGLAMGIRQTAQPLGVALAALTLPPLAQQHGPWLALLLPALACALTATAVVLVVSDPPRPVRAHGEPPPGSPYRGAPDLVRVHVSSALLVVPQFAVAGFTLVYLVGERGWDPSAAGRLVFLFQVAGAAGRILSGVWSDRVRSRLRPMRQLAVTSAALMGVIALGAATGQWFVLAGFGLGALVTVADNGLAYTSVAELAGHDWAGRALGVQNTVQNVAAVITPPALAAVIGDTRYALGFALVAAFPLLAIPMTPVRAERRRAERELAQVGP